MYCISTIEILLDKILVKYSLPIWHDDEIANKKKSELVIFSVSSSGDQRILSVNAITNIQTTTNIIELIQTFPVNGK